MKKRTGNIRDVARETGLSIATVSRAMNGAQSVSATTRDRVLEASERLNYLPNPAARALTTDRSKTIAAIIPTIEHSVFAKFIAAIEQTLNEHHYALVLAISNADPTEELQAARKLLGMGAEAFILSGTDHAPALINLFGARGTPLAFTSVWEPDCPNPTIGYDNAAMAATAIRHLADMGHRKVAVIHGHLRDSDRTQARRRGVEAALPDGVEVAFFETDVSVAGGKQALEEALASGLKFTAVLCFSDILALGTYFCLSEKGLKVAGDISVMGFDNLDWSAHASPALTTIDLPAVEMGRHVAQQLIDHLEKGRPLTHQLVEGEIIERESIRRL